MSLSLLEKALLPYEKTLLSQEKFRRRLGVKEVDQPTYQKYITGQVTRFDRRKNAFMFLGPGNPFGQDIRERWKQRTGYNSLAPLPYAELTPENRIGLSLNLASWQICQSYNPTTLPVTPREARVEVTDKAWMSRLIKKAALFYGAEMVRITRINPLWVYEGVEMPHEYAILCVIPHYNSLVATAPSHVGAASTGEVYSKLKFITTQLADFICGLGWEAMYRETQGHRGPEILVVPTAIDAGVGELARNGHVLSPEYGINMRMKIVTTNLPLEVDKPISFGTHEFCLACENCATYCPGNAIPFGPPSEKTNDVYNNPGFRKWYINAERCLNFWLVDKKNWTVCSGRCISVCPWNEPRVPLHNTVRWLAIHSPQWVKKMLVKGDKALHKRTKKIRRG